MQICHSMQKCARKMDDSEAFFCSRWNSSSNGWLLKWKHAVSAVYTLYTETLFLLAVEMRICILLQIKLSKESNTLQFYYSVSFPVFWFESCKNHRNKKQLCSDVHNLTLWSLSSCSNLIDLAKGFVALTKVFVPIYVSAWNQIICCIKQHFLS